MGGATKSCVRKSCNQEISIHTPRVGSDASGFGADTQNVIFQSTLPVWGATNRQDARRQENSISIHAPRVGSDVVPCDIAFFIRDFNPRSPCGERLDGGAEIYSLIEFQSTLPVWGATAADQQRQASIEISIHAPRVGSDCAAWRISGCIYGFQSTLPVWGATLQKSSGFFTGLFQSTLPVWGATASCMFWHRLTYISIHAPRVGSDG